MSVPKGTTKGGGNVKGGDDPELGDITGGASPLILQPHI